MGVSGLEFKHASICVSVVVSSSNVSRISMAANSSTLEREPLLKARLIELEETCKHMPAQVKCLGESLGVVSEKVKAFPSLPTTNTSNVEPHIQHVGNNLSPTAYSVVANTVSKSMADSYRHQTERKFNVVIYGIKECPRGTPRNERLKMDDASISSSLKQFIPTFSPLCIKESLRLGKYKADSNHPRPLLVKLNCISDVNQILANRKHTTGNIYVKPDLSPEARKIESLLLAERRALINSSTDRKSIRIRGNSLIINDRVHARVVDGVLVRDAVLGELAPQLQDLTVTHTPGNKNQAGSTFSSVGDHDADSVSLNK